MSEPIFTVERVYRLGEFKTFRSTASESDLPDDVRTMLMIETVCDVQKQFLLNQIVEHRLYDKDTEQYEKGLERLEEIKQELIERYVEEE